MNCVERVLLTQNVIQPSVLKHHSHYGTPSSHVAAWCLTKSISTVLQSGKSSALDTDSMIPQPDGAQGRCWWTEGWLTKWSGLNQLHKLTPHFFHWPLPVRMRRTASANERRGSGKHSRVSYVITPSWSRPQYSNTADYVISAARVDPKWPSYIVCKISANATYGLPTTECSIQCMLLLIQGEEWRHGDLMTSPWTEFFPYFFANIWRRREKTTDVCWKDRYRRLSIWPDSKISLRASQSNTATSE